MSDVALQQGNQVGTAHSAAHSITASLTDHGLATTSFPDYESFLEVVKVIGTTIQCTRIENSPKSTRLLASNASMTFHTDSPHSDIVAWYCESEADSGGTSLLHDFGRIERHLSENQMHDLRDVQVKVPGTVETFPALSEGKIYFADWLVTAQSRIRYHETIESLKTALNETKPKEVLLRKGDSLFVDNRRMLHNRTAFRNGERQRLLIRHWIQCGT